MDLSGWATRIKNSDVETYYLIYFFRGDGKRKRNLALIPSRITHVIYLSTVSILLAISSCTVWVFSIARQFPTLLYIRPASCRAISAPLNKKSYIPLWYASSEKPVWENIFFFTEERGVYIYIENRERGRSSCSSGI